jgi:hypothetical protein
MRYAVAFGRFWYDFLIGDQPVLFFGPVIGLAIVALAVQADWASVSGPFLFGLVVASGGLGLAHDLAVIRRRSND